MGARPVASRFAFSLLSCAGVWADRTPHTIRNAAISFFILFPRCCVSWSVSPSLVFRWCDLSRRRCYGHVPHRFRDSLNLFASNPHSEREPGKPRFELLTTGGHVTAYGHASRCPRR